ncbi:MAG TPA: HlyD family efflux transporter periplasmic adaptor subunit [Anaerolineae bacterium]|nr:HlyD family efflux transporter periplasmic adaptor subunit [Anaerolineae bacterium]
MTMNLNRTFKDNGTQIFTNLHRAIKKSVFICVYLCPILLLAACGGGETAVNAPTPTPLPTPIVPEKPTYTVQRGTVVKSLQFTGRVSPVQEQAVFFKTDGFVDQIFVSRGDQVQAGDVLAQLEISGLENQLAQAQVALQTAQARLDQAEQARQDTLAESQISLQKAELQLQQGQINSNSAALTAAQINLENAQTQLAAAQYELQKSRDRSWEPEELRRQYETAVKNAEDNLAIAQAQYNDALAAGGSASVNRQLLELDKALIELKIEQLERGVDPLLELDVERARLDVQTIEQQIADAQLIAPFDGEILSLNVQPGSRAEAFKPVMTLADPDELEITAELGGEQLSQLSVGQAADIALRNRPEETLTGTVRQLPYAFSGGSGGANEDTRVRITIDDAKTLELGELATVTILLEEKENVLWLPPTAIRTFQGRQFVVIQTDDGQQRVDVRLGIESEARVEILEGVAEGQTIIGE